MPTVTFMNLSQEKKDKIIKAAKKEFSRVPISEVLIKNIVEEAEIARGSFYQYFESKEDLLKFLLTEEMEKVDEVAVRILEETSGDIFEVYIGMYDFFMNHNINEEDKKFHKKVLEMMDLVGLAHRFVNSYPHELDGGRRQRIGIARALALNPKFIVCDEPVSALDVSIQAQVLNLMQDIQEKLGVTYLFITHDMSVVKHLSDDIIVMYLGQMVEKCNAERLFENPVHPYTKALLSAIPVADPDYKTERIVLNGELTSPIDPLPGCRFAKRCIYANEECMHKEYALKEVERGHFVSCAKFAV